MEAKAPRIPRLGDGSYDRELVRAAFIASPYLDWTRFAEEQGWDAHQSRGQFPVRTWQKEKKDKLSEAQGDIIAGLLHERKYKWTRDIIDTLERYPKLIDMGSKLAEAKMATLAELYQEYVIWKKEGKHLVQKLNKKTGKMTTVRVYHPWEKVSPMDINFMLKGLHEITQAKIKALMLDKWSPGKLDLPKEDLEPPDPNGDAVTEGQLTIEGGKELTFDQMQGWLDKYLDKPAPLSDPNLVQDQPTSGKAPSFEGEKMPTPKNSAVMKASGVIMLDDDGRVIGGEPEPTRDDGRS